MSAANEAQPSPPMSEILPSIPPTLGSRITGLFQRNAFWVMVDQAITSAGNFIMLWVLGRSLLQAELGAYQVLFETILYLNGLQAALIIYPLLVRGARGNSENLGKLSTASMALTIGLLPVLGGVTILSVVALNRTPSPDGAAATSVLGWSVALSAVLALAFWQLQETTRRALMADLRFKDVLLGDAIRYLGQAGVIWVFAQMGHLNLQLAFVAMGLMSAVAAILQAWQIGLRPIRTSDLKQIALDFWVLGRWMLLANSSGIVTTVGYNWVLAAKHGTEANGLFMALVYCFKVANPLMAGLSGLVTPAVARESVTSNKNATRIALRYTLFGAAIIAVYYLVLLVFAEPLLKLLWGVDKPYWQHANLLRLFVGNYIAIYLLTMITAWLGGLGQSKHTFYVALTNVVMSLVVGLPLTAKFGVAGLIMGGLISSGVSALVAIYFIYHLAHKPSMLNDHKPHSPGSL